MSFDVPIIFIIFNRPELTRRIFEEIRKQKPKHLYVVADGPRSHVESDSKNCDLARAVINQVDWDCEIIRDYSRYNYGCRFNPPRGITNAFERYDRAIILEDDCLPHPTFFQYCRELLTYYVTNERVFTISGNNFFYGERKIQDSYYFTMYPHIWGWATWKRSWNKYTQFMPSWPEFKTSDLFKTCVHSEAEERFWLRFFQQAFEGKVTTWDVYLTYASWLDGAVNINPAVNLVSNIGFGQGVHTPAVSPLANLPVSSIGFPLRHPQEIKIACEFDQKVAAEQYVLEQKNFFQKIPKKLRRKFRQWGWIRG